jgi:hypothetical protein
MMPTVMIQESKLCLVGWLYMDRLPPRLQYLVHYLTPIMWLLLDDLGFVVDEAWTGAMHCIDVACARRGMGNIHICAKS